MTQGAAGGAGRIWRQVIVFYLLTTAIAIAAWLPYGAQLAGVLHTNIPPIVPLLGQYSPMIAALILIVAEGGLLGVARFLKRSLNLFADIKAYAVAIATPPLIGLGLIALHKAQGSYVPSLASLQDLPTHVADFLIGNIHDASGGSAGSVGIIQSIAKWASQGVPQALLALFGLAFANGGISEEPGWRGYALAKLLPGRPVILVGLLVGFFWGLWHTGPAFWEGIFQAKWTVFSIPIQYTIAILPLSVMMTWVFVTAKRSLVPGMIFHALSNGTFFFLTQIWTPGHPALSTPEYLAGMTVAALLVIIFGRRTFFARGGEDIGAQDGSFRRKAAPY